MLPSGKSHSNNCIDLAHKAGGLLELHKRVADNRMDQQTSPKQPEKIKDPYADDTTQLKRLGLPKRWKCVPAPPTTLCAPPQKCVPMWDCGSSRVNVTSVFLQLTYLENFLRER